jgi:hypothetical protein
MLDVNEKQMRGMETAGMSLIGTVAGNRITDHKRNEYLRQEPGITDIKMTIIININKNARTWKERMRTESRSCCIKKTKTLTMSGTE